MSLRFGRVGLPWLRGIAAWGAPSFVTSLQKGTLTILAAGGASNTATINAVDPANAIVFATGYKGGGSDVTAGQTTTRIELTNATTITGFRLLGATAAGTYEYWVIELVPGLVRSIQRGTMTTAASITGTATITEVNPAKCFLFCLGFTSADASITAFDVLTLRLTLTDGVTITANGFGAITRTINYCLVEMF